MRTNGRYLIRSVGEVPKQLDGTAATVGIACAGVFGILAIIGL